MSDLWMPRMIVAGLIAVALAVIGLVAFDPAAPAWSGYVITSVVSGLLGYIVAPQQKPT